MAFQAVGPALGPEPAELGVEHLEHDCLAGLAATLDGRVGKGEVYLGKGEVYQHATT